MPMPALWRQSGRPTCGQVLSRWHSVLAIALGRDPLWQRFELVLALIHSRSLLQRRFGCAPAPCRVVSRCRMWPAPCLVASPGLQRLGLCGGCSLSCANEFDAGGVLGGGRYDIHSLPHSPWFVRIDDRMFSGLSIRIRDLAG